MNNFVKIILIEDCYRYKNADTVEMCILSRFLTSDVYCFGSSRYKEWALDKTYLGSYGGNITNLEKKIIIS